LRAGSYEAAAPTTVFRAGGVQRKAAPNRFQTLIELAVERRLIAGLSAKAQITVRRWLSKIATDLQEKPGSAASRLLPRHHQRR
jgi:hypothetical protein